MSLTRAEIQPRFPAAIAHALASTADGAFVAVDGRIVFWNRSAERILGYPAPEVVGRTCCEVFGGRDGDGNLLCYEGCHIRALVGLDEPVRDFDMRTRTRGGRPVWLNFSVLVVRDDAATPLRIHLFRDVTADRDLLTHAHEVTAAVPTVASAMASLTPRELDVLRLMAQGMNTARTARTLRVSPATVRNHAQRILDKLGVHSRLEAVALVTKHHLL